MNCILNIDEKYIEEVTDWTTGVQFPAGALASRPDLGPTQLPIQWALEIFSPELKRPGREAYHSLPSSAEFKNAWSYNSAPQKCPRGVELN
jgi:hypothetical protein